MQGPVQYLWWNVMWIYLQCAVINCKCLWCRTMKVVSARTSDDILQRDSCHLDCIFVLRLNSNLLATPVHSKFLFKPFLYNIQSELSHIPSFLTKVSFYLFTRRFYASRLWSCCSHSCWKGKKKRKNQSLFLKVFLTFILNGIWSDVEGYRIKVNWDHSLRTQSDANLFLLPGALLAI